MIRIGLTYKYNQETYQKELNEGKEVYLGVPLEILLDEINMLEVKHKEPVEVLRQLKYQLMVATGKWREEEKKEADPNADAGQ